MNKEQYDAYVVRIWQDRSVWRAQVLHMDSGRQRFFTSLGQLCLFWQEETAVTPSSPHSSEGDKTQ